MLSLSDSMKNQAMWFKRGRSLAGRGGASCVAPMGASPEPRPPWSPWPEVFRAVQPPQTQAVTLQGRIVFIQFEVCSELPTIMEVSEAEGSFAEEIAPVWLNQPPLYFLPFVREDCTTGDSVSSLVVTDSASPKGKEGDGLELVRVRQLHPELVLLK